MGYALQAVIAGDEVLRAASREVPGSRVVPLGQGLSLLPMTDEVFDAVFARRVSPISQALRRLGARRSLGEDEFDAVGLSRHRDTSDWMSDGFQA
ncbi:hypothetical protein OG730_29420 [Streptomyces sp. NBC_01298]|uniref:hypothetical protein n=1 Tax=Streptomyces sp. NBC_01298 TaxID=2903817 RepID=UPI002E168498|nr:hypothetical protein OG730_29420 [Streptomyces sp. NBC_01298]